MQSILVHVCNDPDFEARLQTSLDIARFFDAHLTFLQTITPPVVLPMDYTGTAIPPLLPMAQEQAEKLKQDTEARLNDEDVQWDWVQEVGFVDSMLLSHAALNDLVIVGADGQTETEHNRSRLAGILAIEGRSSVMVVPSSSQCFDPSKPALVAWNGSPESARAMRASLALLKRSDSVVLATVTGEPERKSSRLPPFDGASYLARHGIECELIELPCSGRHPAKILVEEAEKRDAGYIVLGAYGHSRLLEIVFGGVTRDMLDDPQIPVFLAH
ncbi:universal stress protein [Pontixanthobacter aquaemixtae]|uniref:Universal stress protein n=1 Tax=Pontixanthobacter aquaemixtae TaxID=1958940 RepID=A0A844ZT05_9SPHN|nr:universal stress protein [Pontixanthobacter aquaemixtae]MXO90136.1 universal stress protein [Pontixanthobacter aquaemixtae]